MKRKRNVTKVLKPSPQAGQSNYTWDLRYKGLKPGKRRTAWGTIYYENRTNRSDNNPRERL